MAKTAVNPKTYGSAVRYFKLTISGYDLKKGLLSEYVIVCGCNMFLISCSKLVTFPLCFDTIGIVHKTIVCMLYILPVTSKQSFEEWILES